PGVAPRGAAGKEHREVHGIETPHVLAEPDRHRHVGAHSRERGARLLLERLETAAVDDPVVELRQCHGIAEVLKRLMKRTTYPRFRVLLSHPSRIRADNQLSGFS